MAEPAFQAIVGFRLVAADLDTLTAFYREIGFEVGPAEPIGEAEMTILGLAGRGWRRPMRYGASRVDLDAFERPGRPYPPDTRACDLAFQHMALVTDHIEAAWRRAQAAGASPISREGPVRLPASAGAVTAMKFRDPEGHPLEFLQFPDAKAAGAPRIDHSAVAVRDLAVSRRFYETRGLQPQTGSLNQGPTQAALDNLDGVELTVAPMAPAQAPPHLELLAYRAPVPAATAPRASNDVAATRIVWRSASEGLLADPDGHLHQRVRPDRSPGDTASRR